MVISTAYVPPTVQYVPAIQYAQSANDDVQRPSLSFDSDFKKIADDRPFVDKTLLIKAIFNETPGVVISAPRRFGKTTNLHTLKNFLEIEVDYHGIKRTLADIDVEPIRDTNNYNYFVNRNLNITKELDIMDKHFGKYPVLFFDMKHIIGANFNEILTEARNAIHDTFRAHSYLLRSKDFLNEEDRELFRFFGGNLRSKLLDANELETALDFLASLLYQYFKRKVFVLIDEYDAPIVELLLKQNDDYLKTINFTRNLVLTLVKNNPSVQQVFLTASTKMSSFLLPEGNCIEHYPFLGDHVFSQFYGLTEMEVNHMLRQYKLENKFQEISDWYGGYKIINKNIEIFNPWSVLQCIKLKKIDYFWRDAGDIANLEKIFKLDKVRAELRKLLDNKVMTIQFDKPMEDKHLYLLRNFLQFPTADHCYEHLFIQFLFENAYFSPVKSTRDTLKLRVPNQEVWSLLRKYYCSMKYYIEKFNQNDIIAFYLALDSLSPTFNHSLLFYNFTIALKEMYSGNSFQSANEFEFSSHLYTFARNKYELIDCNTLIGKTKKVDIVIIREDKVAIIIEITYKKSSALSLKQILDKKYYIILDRIREAVRDRIFIGINVDENRIVSASYLINTCDIRNAMHVSSELNNYLSFC